MKYIVAAGFVLALCTAAEADVYKQVGADGVISFTNVPKSPSNYTWVMYESGRAKAVTPSISSNARVRYEDIITTASTRYGVEVELIKAVIKAESNFNQYAVSRAGARGLMQLMPETARHLGVRDSFDAAENVNGGVRYLGTLIGKFNGDVELALAAYNAGITAVKKYGTIPPFKETIGYVKKVLAYQDRYLALSEN